MNRRELFKGIGAAMAAATIPYFPSEEILAQVSDSTVIVYLKRARADLVNKIVYPPCIMYEDGRMEQMKTDVWQTGLEHVNRLLKELET